MTREDIIQTAFKVWGRELYQTMSLSGIAGELGVSKAALYRHFKDKQALLGAMDGYFFDEYAAFIKKDYERALAEENLKERCFIMVRSISEYYGRNEDALFFSLFQIFGSRQVGKFSAQMISRGVDFVALYQKSRESYREPLFFPYMAHLVMVSVIFWLGQFHHFDHKSKGFPAGGKLRRSPAGPEVRDEEIRALITDIEERISSGLGLDAEKVDALDYPRLEEKAALTLPKDTEDNRLLSAVAGAVAEAGLSHASMEMVAHRSGLAKSSLYSHFKNKQDMLDTLLLTEFTRIAAYVRDNIKTSTIPEEQLYLGVASIAAYLQSRPNILAVMDWLRTQRPKIRPRLASESQRILPEIYRIITDIDLPALGETGDKKDHAAQWILFLTVKGLIWRLEIDGLEAGTDKAAPGCGSLNTESIGAGSAPENMRLLYRFIARGLEGFSL